MKILSTDPSAQFVKYQTEIEDAVINVLRNGQYILGSEVNKFEEEFANFIGAKYSIGVANGTDALEISLRSLNISYGDEVITVSHTAVATVSAIEACGAKPILVDVEDDYFTVNTSQIETVITERTKAIIAVHLYGQPVDIESISLISKKYGLYLIEDVSQAHGSTFNNKCLGNFGVISCFSCYPTKNLGAIGDAGVIATNDAKLAKLCRSLRQYGWSQRFISEDCGRNSRLDEVQAAILRVKLRYLKDNNERRINHANTYKRLLSDIPITLPKTRMNSKHVFHLFVIRTSERDRLKDYLITKNIFCGVHYPLPIHMQPAYKNRILTSNNMRTTEKISTEILSLPMYPELKDDHIHYVAQSIKEFNFN